MAAEISPGGSPPTADPEPTPVYVSPIKPMRLRELAESDRFRELDRFEAYYRCTQDEVKKYDWDGNLMGYAGEADIQPGWYVPISRRRPSSRYDLAKIIVNRLTTLLFGPYRWPQLTVPFDPVAEDFAQELVTVSRLPSKMREARKKGGSQGTACLSFAYRRGRPVVRVHNAKHCTVLEWDDPDNFRPAVVIECYAYRRRDYDPLEKAWRDKDFFYVRYWDTMREIVYDAIPSELADKDNWAAIAPYNEVVHGYGFCPFYWIQNIANSEDVDGDSDFEGLLDDFDEINRLTSATSRGTIANVDPTLVVNMDPHDAPEGTIRKGSGNAIFSKGGASYLELKGEAVRGALELFKQKKLAAQESAQVVLVDPDKLAAQALSGKALELVYAPMLAACDDLRDQYSDFGIKPIVRDMLRAARIILARPTQTVEGPNGPMIYRETIDLPPRVEQTESGGVVYRNREPGQSEQIELQWGKYFPHSWVDVEQGTRAASAAAGNKPVISQKTAVRMAAELTGVADVDAEMEAIDEDAEASADRAMRTFGGPPEPILRETGKDNPDEEGGDDGKDDEEESDDDE